MVEALGGGGRRRSAPEGRASARPVPADVTQYDRERGLVVRPIELALVLGLLVPRLLSSVARTRSTGLPFENSPCARYSYASALSASRRLQPRVCLHRVALGLPLVADDDPAKALRRLRGDLETRYLS